MTREPSGTLPGQIAAAILTASRDGPPLVSCNVIATPEGHGAPLGAKMLVFTDGDVLGDLGGGPVQEAAKAVALEAIPRHAVETVFFTTAGEEDMEELVLTWIEGAEYPV